MNFLKLLVIVMVVFSSSVCFAKTTEDEDFATIQSLYASKRYKERTDAAQLFWTDYPNATLPHKQAIALILCHVLTEKQPDKSIEFGQFLINSGFRSGGVYAIMANSYSRMNNYKDALTKINTAISDFNVGHTHKADILYKSGDKASAIALMKERKEFDKEAAYTRLLQWTTDATEKETLLDESIAACPSAEGDKFRVMKIKSLIAKKQTAAAISFIEGMTVVRADVVSLYADIKGDAAATAALVVKMLKTREPSSLTASESTLLRKLVPGNDAINCMLTNAQGVADGYKQYLRRQTIQINNTAIAAFVKQLNTGDGTKALVVSDEAKALATAIAAAGNDVKMGPFLVPMLKGEYNTAAKLAFAQAKAAKTDDEYKFWISALSAAVRCNDQCYNKKAVDVIKWVNGELQQNPIEDLLK